MTAVATMWGALDATTRKTHNSSSLVASAFNHVRAVSLGHSPHVKHGMVDIMADAIARASACS
jgi:hypothetical protein